MPTCFDENLFSHDVMATLGSRLNYHLHRVSLDIEDSWIRNTTYQELLFLHGDLRKKVRRTAIEESDVSVYDSYLIKAEEGYLEDNHVMVVDLEPLPASLVRDEMRAYFTNRQRSVGRNEVAHPYSAGVESHRGCDSNGFFFYVLHDSPTARGKDPRVTSWLLDGLDKLEALCNSDKLPESLSKSKTCFRMQLGFLKSIFTKPSEDAKDAWVTVARKGQRPVKTTPKASGN